MQVIKRDNKRFLPSTSGKQQAADNRHQTSIDFQAIRQSRTLEIPRGHSDSNSELRGYRGAGGGWQQSQSAADRVENKPSHSIIQQTQSYIFILILNLIQAQGQSTQSQGTQKQIHNIIANLHRLHLHLLLTCAHSPPPRPPTPATWASSRHRCPALRSRPSCA